MCESLPDLRHLRRECIAESRGPIGAARTFDHLISQFHWRRQTNMRRWSRQWIFLMSQGIHFSRSLCESTKVRDRRGHCRREGIDGESLNMSPPFRYDSLRGQEISHRAPPLSPPATPAVPPIRNDSARPRIIRAGQRARKYGPDARPAPPAADRCACR
ncbi:MAG: hypothetical protein QOK37_1676 [Thermoanaerobaculia bacterium]|jgi:hypothetical protein|nr:hypothetical protein [Thermoanaerobaculia bacterium]